VVFYVPLTESGYYANCGCSRLRNYFVPSEPFFPEDRFRTFRSCCPTFRRLTRYRSMTRPIPRQKRQSSQQLHIVDVVMHNIVRSSLKHRLTLRFHALTGQLFPRPLLPNDCLVPRRQVVTMTIVKKVKCGVSLPQESSHVPAFKI
jgi:hypothetical protein